MGDREDRASRYALGAARKRTVAIRADRRASLTGKRQDLVKQADGLMEAAGASIKADLAADTGYAKEFLSTLKFGASRECMDRTCIGIMARLYKLAGEENKLTIELVHRMGASSEEQLRQYVEAAKSVEGASLHDSAERCVSFLEQYLNAHPQMRVQAVKRLGGQVPHAEVVG